MLLDPSLNIKLLFPVICVQTPHYLHVTLGKLREELKPTDWGGLIKGVLSKWSRGTGIHVGSDLSVWLL